MEGRPGEARGGLRGGEGGARGGAGAARSKPVLTAQPHGVLTARPRGVLSLAAPLRTSHLCWS